MRSLIQRPGDRQRGLGLVLACLLCGSAVWSPAWSQDSEGSRGTAAEPLQAALARLRQGDYEAAERQALEKRSELLDRAGEDRTRRHLQLLALVARGAALQQSRATPAAMRAWISESALVSSSLEVVDVPFLDQLRSEAPLSVRAQVKRWLSTGREGARRFRDLPSYLRAMSVTDAAVRRIATAGLARHLAIQRQVVERGGALSPEARQLFQSRVLHEVLIHQLEREASFGAVDSLSPLELAIQSESARALHALAIIAEPCRLSVEAASLAGMRRASLALDAIEKEILRRALAFPGASWDEARPRPEAPRSDSGQ